MNLDLLFEDLETHFDSVLEQAKQRPAFGIERLTTSVAGNRLSIDRPLFGRDFICGLVSGQAIWRFQPHRSISVVKLSFSKEQATDSELQDSSDFLADSLIGRFARYAMHGDGQQIRKGRVISVLHGLLLFESTAEVIAITIDRLAWLEIHAGDN